MIPVHRLLCLVGILFSGCSNNENNVYQQTNPLTDSSEFPAEAIGLGRSGSGNHNRLSQKINPNSISLSKSFGVDRFGRVSVILTPDAKLAVGYKDINGKTQLTVATLRPTPNTGVNPATNNLGVKNPVLAGEKVIEASLNGEVGRADPFQGHLAIDPRYSQGLPFKVSSVDNCKNARPYETHQVIDLDGLYECYYLIHFDTLLQNERSEDGVGINKAHFTVATLAFDPKGRRLTNPRVEYAAFTSSYQRLQDDLGNGARGGIELSGTADGRVLINIKGKILWNPDPWKIKGWKFNLLGSIHKEADTEICRQRTCSPSQREKFGDLYPFAKYPIRNYRGDFFPSPEALTCGYLWMHPEGTDVFCRMNTQIGFSDSLRNKIKNAGENFGEHTYPPDSAHESSTGMYYQIMGQSTRWTVRTIDGAVNTQRHELNANAIDRPFSLLFLGMSSGFWSDELGTDPASKIPLNPRGVNYQFFTHVNHFVKDSRKILAHHIEQESGDAVLQYWETDISDCTDARVSIALRFKAQYYYDKESDRRTEHVLDSACHFKAKKSSKETGPNPIVSRLNKTNLIFHTADLRLSSDDLRAVINSQTAGSMMGFRGEGLWVKKGGLLVHEVDKNHPHTQPKPDGFSLEFATSLMNGLKDANDRMKLISIPGIVEVGARKGEGDSAIVFYAQNKTSSPEVTIESQPVKASFQQPIENQALVKGDWHHVGVRFKPGKFNNRLRFELIINGQLVSGVSIAKNDLVGKTEALRIHGSCRSCPRSDLFIIDEVVISSVARSLDYFAAGAYVVSSENRKFLSYEQNKSLLNNFGFASDSLMYIDLAREVFIPRQFAQYARPSAKNEALELIKLGELLFKSPLLSVDTTLKPQLQQGTSKPVSCATCHMPTQAFTDNKRIAIGIKEGTLNTPTIFNRAFGRKHFFDQKSDSLIDQALIPIRNPDEMNSSVKNVIQAISGRKDIVEQFKKANLNLDEQGLAIGLTAFTLKKTLLLETLVKTDSPANNGEKLFFGKARCASCHNGPSLTNERMHDTGVSEEAKSIKTPSLVKISRTAPYFHNGSKQTLEEVVDFYDSGFLEVRSPTRPLDLDMRPLGLSDEEKIDLVEFLRTLKWRGAENFRPVQSENVRINAELPMSDNSISTPKPKVERPKLVMRFSNAGMIPGMTCIGMRESSDPHTWHDNYICSNYYIGLRWSSAGAISGMKCTRIHESADNEGTWFDNYLCLPQSSPHSLTWSSSGTPVGRVCERVYESEEPAYTTWYDNYLCYE